MAANAKDHQSESIKPRRPLTGYNLFYQDVVAQKKVDACTGRLGGLIFVTKDVAKSWGELDPVERGRYEAAGKVLQERYREAMNSYRAEHQEDSDRTSIDVQTEETSTMDPYEIREHILRLKRAGVIQDAVSVQPAEKRRRQAEDYTVMPNHVARVSADVSTEDSNACIGERSSGQSLFDDESVNGVSVSSDLDFQLEPHDINMTTGDGIRFREHHPLLYEVLQHLQDDNDKHVMHSSPPQMADQVETFGLLPATEARTATTRLLSSSPR